MAKARHILAAMDRHPDEVIVWLDVDCIVHGDCRPRRHPRRCRVPHALEVSPTPQGRSVPSAVRHHGVPPHTGGSSVRRAMEAGSERAPYGEIDQSSQVVAMAESIGTTFVPLPLIYCVNPDEKAQGTRCCRSARFQQP